jgi:hypothetical protein
LCFSIKPKPLPNSHISMKANKIKEKELKGERFKLQIDYRTIIIVRGKEALKRWLSKFPEAKLITV